jgi:phosphoribosylaminoimidazole-succinocarboxamide synthase
MKASAARSKGTLAESRLPLPLLRRGKVREVYEVDAGHLLVVASDRVSAFDVVMREPIPRKGAVLTQISAFWFELLADVFPSHYLTARTKEILERVPQLEGLEEQIAGRAMLVRRAVPVPFECVVRGYLSGSAWAEYRSRGTLAGEPLAPGLVESARLDPPLFSPATKAESGHDINVTADTVAQELGPHLAARLRQASFALYQAGRDHAASRGIIIADTKFEFGTDMEGTLRLIDEVLTPDSSRFWPADRYAPGRAQPSFDKQPLRDYLASLKAAGSWDGEAPPPPLPADVVEATSRRYLEAFRLLTGRDLEHEL